VLTPAGWLECVANVSEGREPAVLDALSSALQAVPDLQLWHRDAGWDAHRTVYTFAGPADAVVNGCIALVGAAAAHIDMRKHHGAHPRIGAVDVCPLVALRPEDSALADQSAERVASGLSALTAGGWFYSRNARRPEFRLLANVRKGQYEGLEVRQNDLDFGTYHPAFGAMALGARDFLLAYNVNLSETNLAVAKAIAAAVREHTGGGLPGVRAIGWDTPEFACSQVSCNVTDISQAALKDVYDAVDQLARNYGLLARGSELIGMPPLSAFRGFSSAEEGANYLGLSSVVPFEVRDRVIEYRFA
jgi:glutamate formiminotransferase/formiminotetrahydrofolate cyclodeaminase